MKEMTCYLPEPRFRRIFVREVSKRFALEPPVYLVEGVRWYGTEEEVQLLSLFYAGMDLYRRDGR